MPHDGKNLIPVPMKNFLDGRISNADVFLKLSEDKYVKIVNSGQPFDGEQVFRYTKNEITNLYIGKDDYSDHIEDCINLAVSVKNSDQLNPAVKMRVFSQIAETVIKEMKDLGFNEDVFEHAAKVTEGMTETLKDHSSISKVLNDLAKISEHQARHFVGVSIVSTMISINMGWEGDKTLSVISQAGLLHDIGLCELPPELLRKRRVDMKSSEVAEYRTHSERGKAILLGIKDIPTEIIQIVCDHHELPSGAGFPRGLRKSAIFPLSRVVALADIICHDILETEDSSETLTVVESTKRLGAIFQNDFDQVHWDAMHSIIASDSKIKIKAS